MRHLSSITLVLGEACNFFCFYCPQRRGKNKLTIAAIRRFLDFLDPRLAEEVWLGFYGGEPLLHWPLIEKTVNHAQRCQERRFRFALSSNGSLLRKEHVLFFREHRFALGLSYDGLAQGYRDADSVAAVEKALAMLLRLYPEGYTVNSVFTPRTVALLAPSMEKLMRQGHRHLRISLDLTCAWPDSALEEYKRQLEHLAGACREHHDRCGKLPLENFIPEAKQGVFACGAGHDRLALLPDNTVWGCEIFHTLLGHDRDHPDYARYSFGTLTGFMAMKSAARAAVEANYKELRQDFFISEKGLCGLCDELEHCDVCPGTAALATGVLALFPSWTCQLKKISRREQEKLAAAPRSPAAGKEHGHFPAQLKLP